MGLDANPGTSMAITFGSHPLNQRYIALRRSYTGGSKSGRRAWRRQITAIRRHHLNITLAFMELQACMWCTVVWCSTVCCSTP